MMNKLHYDSPARFWREALPIGNGFTGVMIYGGRKTETLCFNDATLWSGYPKDYNNSQSLEYIGKVRELIFAGKNSEADALAQKKMIGFYSESFLPLGEVSIQFKDLQKGGYKRELDLSKAIHSVYSDGITRETFASHPDGVVACRITSEYPVTAVITAKSKLKSKTVCDDGLFLTGRAPDYVAPNYLRSELFPVKYKEKKGMAFCLGMKVRTNGQVCYRGKSLTITHFTEAVLIFSTATGFIGYDQMPLTDRKAVKKICAERLNGCQDSYDVVKNRHIEDFRTLYQKQSISLGGESELTTNRLLGEVKKGGDVRAICELFYNYGKYMTVSASRRGGQPMNLQGIWNASIRPPWSSNYTVNINTQMNYWGASVCGLFECLEPFLQMVYKTMERGKKTAEINYGCRGFACNHNVDLWRKTPPVRGTSNYMLEPLCGVWLANEIYAHYRNGAFSGQKDAVREIVEQGAKFCLDYLVLHDGKYVICPSPSPENYFVTNAKNAYLDYASAFDMGLVRQVFANALEISGDLELKSEILEKQPQLYPFKKGENGICEWHTHFETPEKGHRHFSPLYAFYPGREIGFYSHREQTEWVRELFHYRLKHSGQYIGWSAAWAICLAARLREGETVLSVIRDFLSHSVFSNLFCVHPPFLFQIDGNMGYVAGINEMLLSEERGKIELLPALPDEFADSGEVRNMFVCGAKISFRWKDGLVTAITSDKPVTVLGKRLSKSVTTEGDITVHS